MDIQDLSQQIKENCNISDAQYWGYLSLCNMLFRLRELYLHEHSMKPWEKPVQGEIGSWIQEREALWETLEERELSPLSIGEHSFDPFDTEGINALLEPQGWIYGGGVGVLGKPLFFLGRVRSSERHGPLTVRFTEGEICRDLSPFPAMHRDREVFIRLDILSGFLYSKFLEFRKGSRNDILTKAYAHYGFDGEETSPEVIEEKISRLTDEVSRMILWHELGEATEKEEQDTWLTILEESGDKLTELMIRAVKDLVSDTGEEGPLSKIIRSRDEGLLLFYFTLMDELRKPRVGALKGIVMERENRNGGFWESLEEERLRTYRREKEVQREILRKWNDGGDIKTIRTFLRGEVFAG